VLYLIWFGFPRDALTDALRLNHSVFNETQPRQTYAKGGAVKPLVIGHVAVFDSTRSNR
jgi:hypothetical protein